MKGHLRPRYYKCIYQRGLYSRYARYARYDEFVWNFLIAQQRYAYLTLKPMHIRGLAVIVNSFYFGNICLLHKVMPVLILHY